MSASRTLWSIVFALFALALTACGQAPAVGESQTWLGTTTIADAEFELRVDVVLDRHGGWTGTYTVGSAPPFTGEVAAEFADGAVAGALIATSSCRFAFEGTIDGDELEATFAPTECDGGSAGSWSARRQ